MIFFFLNLFGFVLFRETLHSGLAEPKQRCPWSASVGALRQPLLTLNCNEKSISSQSGLICSPAERTAINPSL